MLELSVEADAYGNKEVFVEYLPELITVSYEFMLEADDEYVELNFNRDDGQILTFHFKNGTAKYALEGSEGRLIRWEYEAD